MWWNCRSRAIDSAVEVHLQAKDPQILGWLENDFVAIDAPFGWPIAFNQVIGSWMSSEPKWLPEEGRSERGKKEWEEDKELLKFRLTDRFVRHHLRDEHKKKSEHNTFPKLQRRHKTCDWPLGLAVAAEKIAITSFRAVPLLHRAQIDDRTGMTGSAIEVYPGSALAEWCMYVTYKDTAGESNRAELCDELSKQIRDGILRIPLELDDSSLDEAVGLMKKSDHVFDAMVAAITGWAALIGQTHVPTPDACQRFWDGPGEGKRIAERLRRQYLDEQLEVDEIVKREGWIHHPTTTVEEIMSIDPRTHLRARLANRT